MDSSFFICKKMKRNFLIVRAHLHHFGILKNSENSIIEYTMCSMQTFAIFCNYIRLRWYLEITLYYADGFCYEKI